VQEMVKRSLKSAGQRRVQDRSGEKFMRNRSRTIAGLLIAAGFGLAAHAGAQTSTKADWKAQMQRALPLLGHRNWILIVDSAYPLQVSPGVDTVETNANQLDVVKEVLRTVDDSIHVRPVVYMDAELPFVPEKDAPGVEEYRRQIKEVLGERAVHSAPHEEIIHRVDEEGKTFHILVLKTNLAIPYTSVFLQLNCKYWSDDAEARLRAAMKQAPTAHE
jgi:hypothetical protein